MSWYYSKNGTQLGPIPEEELIAKAGAGEVLPADLVWKEGMADWKPLSQVPEFHSMPTVQASSGGQIVQPPPVTDVVQKPIPTYLWQSIVVTMLCCVPFGVVAIVYAAKVDGLVARGDIAAAQAASKSAKLWVNIGAVTGALIIVAAVVGSLLTAPINPSN